MTKLSVPRSTRLLASTRITWRIEAKAMPVPMVKKSLGTKASPKLFKPRQRPLLVHNSEAPVALSCYATHDQQVRSIDHIQHTCSGIPPQHGSGWPDISQYDQVKSSFEVSGHLLASPAIESRHKMCADTLNPFPFGVINHSCTIEFCFFFCFALYLLAHARCRKLYGAVEEGDEEVSSGSRPGSGKMSSAEISP